MNRLSYWMQLTPGVMVGHLNPEFWFWTGMVTRDEDGMFLRWVDDFAGWPGFGFGWPITHVTWTSGRIDSSYYASNMLRRI